MEDRYAHRHCRGEKGMTQLPTVLSDIVTWCKINPA